MSITVAKLIEYLKDVVDKEKPVRFGTWDNSKLAHTNISDFEGMYISAIEVIITNGVIEPEVSSEKGSSN